MCHDNYTTNDQIAAGGRSGGAAARGRGSARLLLEVFPQGLHPAPTVCLLALKTFFKTDYRGLVQLLQDFAELREELRLDDVPHYSTLCYAAKRLLKKGRSSSSSSRPP